MVVILHFPFEGLVGGIIGSLSRIGVPFFFMVSGFFSYNEANTEIKQRKRFLKGIVRYFLLTVGINIVYSGKSIIRCIIGQITISELLNPFCNAQFIVANFGGNTGFLWFIRALLYIDVILLLFGKYIMNFFKRRISIFFLLLLWLLDVLVMKYGNILFNLEISGSWAEFLTKYIGTGVLYFFCGLWCQIHKDKIFEVLSNLCMILIIALSLALVLNVLEYWALTNNGINRMPVNYLFTFPCVVIIFALLLINGSWGNKSFLSFIGQKISMYIYYWHGLLGGSLLSSLWVKLGFTKAFYGNAIVVYLEAMILGLCIYYAKIVISRNSNRLCMKVCCRK